MTEARIEIISRTEELTTKTLVPPTKVEEKWFLINVTVILINYSDPVF